MGFGTLNPEPAPGKYDWESLDRRMRLTDETGGRVTLTLCCAPDWMKGGAPGTTDWTRLEDDPLPEHFADFAALAAAAVQRYPQVERVLVWNELKGFYRTDLNRWDQEGYTALYNAVYRAVKAVRPDVQVGGPYVVLASLDPGRPDASDLHGRGARSTSGRSTSSTTGSRTRSAPTSWPSTATPRPGTAPARPHSTSAPRSTRPSTGGCAPARTCRSGGPSSTRTSPTESRPARRARPAPRPPSPPSRRSRRRGRGRRCCGARRATSSGTPRCGPTAPTPDGGRPTPLTAAWRWLVPRLAEGRVEIGRSPTRDLVAFRADDGLMLVNLTGAPVDPGDGGGVLPAWGIDVPDEGP